MARLVQTVALAAALATLVTCIWRDYSVMIALRRLVTAYLATFFVAGSIALVARLLAGQRPPSPEVEEPRRPAWRGRARAARAKRKADAPPSEAGDPPPQNEVQEPQPEAVATAPTP